TRPVGWIKQSPGSTSIWSNRRRNRVGGAEEPTNDYSANCNKRAPRVGRSYAKSYSFRKTSSSNFGLMVIARTVVVSSNFPVFRSVSVFANENQTPATCRNSERCCSIVVGVGSISTCNGRISRRRVINHDFGSTYRVV